MVFGFFGRNLLHFSLLPTIVNPGILADGEVEASGAFSAERGRRLGEADRHDRLSEDWHPCFSSS